MNANGPSWSPSPETIEAASITEFAQQARLNAVNAMIKAGLQMGPEELLLELNEVIQEFTSNHEHHFDKLLLRLPPVLPSSPPAL